MSATDFNGNTVTTAYNKLNKETEVVTPMEENVTAKVKYFYDAAGNVTKQYQQNNKPGEAERFKLVETVYNSMNQPVSVISNDGNIDNIVKYEYDGIGNITKMATGITNINDAIDPSVHGVTTYTYNYLNQLVSTTDPQGHTVTNTYDKLGNVTNVTDKSGGTASYTYNGLGQILSVTANRDGKTEDISYQYDWMGNIKQVSDSSGTTNYTYDGLGQLLKETKGGVVKDYTYDANGNRKSFKLTNSGTIELNTTYAYDIQNRLISVTNDGETTSYSYDNNGNLLTATGAVSTQYTYNDANMLTAQTNTAGSNVIGQYNVSYYLDGNKESIAETGKPTTSYLYDDMGRLTQEVVSGESQTSYQYDSFLNRSEKVEKDAEGNVIKTNTYQYNKNNWLLEDRETAGESQGNEVIRNFFYDNMGNQTMKTITTIGEAAGSQSVTIGEDPNGIQLFEYDPLNRMTKSTINNVTTTHTYDANGLRQSKTTNGVTTSHIYDGQNIVMDDKAGEKQVFVRGLSPISRTVNGGSKEYYSFNTHGDTAQLVNASGTILKDYTYDAFGNQKQEQSEDNNPFRYCGEYQDLSSGLIYLRSRYYDPSIGRFISEDSARAGLNWYIYCENNPINMIDPFGEDAIIITNNEAAAKFGHTSAVYQDANGDWFYTYWGNKAAAVIRIPDEYMGSLNDFNSGLNKFLSDNGFIDITSDYDMATYIVGDFTESLKAAYADVNEAATSNFLGIKKGLTSLDDGSLVFQGKNEAYGLLNVNCLDKTYASLSKGTLSNGMNAGTYMKNLGFKGGMRPDNAASKFAEVFMNNSFTYGGAYSALLNYATLYVQGSPWAQKWEKANYANSVIGW